MGSADRIRLGIGAAALTAALTGCGWQPEAAQLRADAARLHPGLHPDCTVIDAGPGEGDSDTVYMHLRLDCQDAQQERWLVFGYTRHTSGWQLFSYEHDERSVRGMIEGPSVRQNASQ